MSSTTRSPRLHRTRAGAAKAERRQGGHSAAGLTLAALGVVFGDIGTSPLYSMQTVFSAEHNTVQVNQEHVYGIISLVFWSITIIVTLKYVTFVIRADNDGEGGILSLTTLVRRQFARQPRWSSIAAVAGLVGASLFFGDSIITPAISVLSAVEGIEVAYPDFPHIIVPIALVILVILFASQKYGTSVVGKAFGPIMLIWFLVLAALGLPHVIANPGILAALNPYYSWSFIMSEPLIAFIAMGSVVLSVTGAEALYADVGHFGRTPIQRAWLYLIWPCLTINYLGQGAMILADPETASNPFFRMGPAWSVVPLVILACIATVIASQAVISGAYSVARQAMRLGYLPNLEIKQTSEHESGQIYLPLVTGVLFASVVTIVVLFQSSVALASAYGLAVTTTLTLETLLFCVFARKIWRWPRVVVILFGALILSLEFTYFIANLAKLPSGGWLPLLIGGVLFFIMTTWQTGRARVVRRRELTEGTIQDFLAALAERTPERVPGVVVYPNASERTVPLALRQSLSLNRVLHERVLLVRVQTIDVPHIEECDRVEIREFPEAPAGVYAVTLRYGFFEPRNVPRSLQLAAERLGRPELDVSNATFLLSHVEIEAAKIPGLRGFRRSLFALLSKVSAPPARHFGLPSERTIELVSRMSI
ncbi:Low affinity potassium transport system protein kup [Pseudoclavibacter triregionum]|nr:Low affinity potassium transport system protein kup [Pseudoclavibacter triregionum]